MPSTVAKIGTNANAHFKTEIAFSHVKEHELVEASCQKGRLALGSANIELDLRVQLMQQACDKLRQNRFFLMAISLKEKEKNLLIQSFEYGEQEEENKQNTVAREDSNKVSEWLSKCLKSDFCVSAWQLWLETQRVQHSEG